MEESRTSKEAEENTSNLEEDTDESSNASSSSIMDLVPECSNVSGRSILFSPEAMEARLELRNSRVHVARGTTVLGSESFSTSHEQTQNASSKEKRNNEGMCPLLEMSRMPTYRRPPHQTGNASRHPQRDSASISDNRCQQR